MNPGKNNKEKTLRIGFFGGTFDPPHIGHSMACFYCLERGLVDRIIVAPCPQHAFGKDVTATFADRLEMTRRAMARLGGAIEVSGIQEEQPQPSYTIDTIRALHRTLPAGAGLRLIIGSDNLPDFDRWKEAEELKRLAPLIIVPRTEDIPDNQKNAKWNEFAIPAVSSTQVRERLRNGEDVSDVISALVLDYIRENGLYKNKK